MSAVSFAVDVSNNQAAHQPWGTFGVHMGIAKASEGRHSHDPWFVRHMTDIKAAGLLPGAYHFAWPNQSAAAEAANYIAAVDPAAGGTPFVHILDLERYPNGARNYLGVNSAQIRQYAHDWITAVKAACPGQKVGIYTSGDDILDGHLPGNEDFLWYPKYPVQNRTFAQAAAAARPTPSGRTVWGWQFTSVPRDQTVIYMAPDALRAWAGGRTPTEDQEDDMALSDEDKKWLATTVKTAAKDAVREYFESTRYPSVTGGKDAAGKPRTLYAIDHLRGVEPYAAQQHTAANVAALLQLVRGLGDGDVPTLDQIEQAVRTAMADTVNVAVTVHAPGPGDDQPTTG